MMWTWVAIVLIVIVLMVFFKFKEIRHKLGLVFVALLLIFLLVSFSSIYAVHKQDLTTFDGVVSVGKVYFSWLGGLFGNLGKVTSYVVHQDWGANFTNSSSLK